MTLTKAELADILVEKVAGMGCTVLAEYRHRTYYSVARTQY